MKIEKPISIAPKTSTDGKLLLIDFLGNEIATVKDTAAAREIVTAINGDYQRYGGNS